MLTTERAMAHTLAQHMVTILRRQVKPLRNFDLTYVGTDGQVHNRIIAAKSPSEACEELARLLKPGEQIINCIVKERTNG